MNIVVLTAYIDLHEEYRQKYRITTKQSNDPKIVSQFSPSLFFQSEIFKVVEDQESHFLRENGDAELNYEFINTFKAFSEEQEYDYEDEVLNYPCIIEFNTRTITGTIPTTEDNVENAKDILANKMIEKLELEILRSQIMIASLHDKNKRRELS